MPIVDWLYYTAWLTSIVIAIILLVSPLVSRFLSAKAAYSLWALILVAGFTWTKTQLPEDIVDISILPNGGISLQAPKFQEVTLISRAWHLELYWLVGMLAYIVFRCFSDYSLRRSVKLSEASPSTQREARFLLKSILKAFPAHLQAKKHSFIFCSHNNAPFVYGVFKPKVVLPHDFFTRYDEKTRYWILKHELMHIERRDLLARVIAVSYKAIFWFHPAFYLAWPRFTQDQEQACDYDILKNSTKEDRHEYAHALLQGLGKSYAGASVGFFTSYIERFALIKYHHHSRIKLILSSLLLMTFAAFLFIQLPPKSSTVNFVDIGFDYQQQQKSPPPAQLHRLLASVGEASGKTINADEFQHSNSVIYLEAYEVPAKSILRFVLNCFGYDYIETKNMIRIVPLKTNAEADKFCTAMINVETTEIHNASEGDSGHKFGDELEKTLTQPELAEGEKTLKLPLATVNPPSEFIYRLENLKYSLLDMDHIDTHYLPEAKHAEIWRRKLTFEHQLNNKIDVSSTKVARVLSSIPGQAEVIEENSLRLKFQTPGAPSALTLSLPLLANRSHASLPGLPRSVNRFITLVEFDLTLEQFDSASGKLLIKPRCTFSCQHAHKNPGTLSLSPSVEAVKNTYSVRIPLLTFDRKNLRRQGLRAAFDLSIQFVPEDNRNPLTSATVQSPPDTQALNPASSGSSSSLSFKNPRLSMRIFENGRRQLWRHYQAWDEINGNYTKVWNESALVKWKEVEQKNNNGAREKVLDLNFLRSDLGARFYLPSHFFTRGDRLKYKIHLGEFREGSLTFKLKILNNAAKHIRLAVSLNCVKPCQNADLTEIDFDKDSVNKWQKITIHVHELRKNGFDPAIAEAAFQLLPIWDRNLDIHLQLKDIRWLRH